MIEGVGPAAPIETNPHGGHQSASPYFFRGLPPLALLVVAEIMKAAAAKYELDPEGPYKNVLVRNWHKIEPWEHEEHALQHMLAHLAGDPQDDHLGHALTRLMMAVHQRESKK